MKQRSTIILTTMGLMTWLLIAASQFLMQPSGSFLDRLIFNVPTIELIPRAVALAAFLLAAVIVAGNSRALESTVDRLAKSDAKYTSIMGNLPVGVYRITPDGRILESNRQFAEILGFKDTNTLMNAGVNLNDVCTNKPDRQAHLEKLREGPSFAEFELLRHDGRTTWIRDYPRATLNTDRTIAYIDGVCVEMHGIDAIMRDLAEHKRLQGMQEHFIVTATHELRTPLVSINGYIDLILAREQGLSSSLKSKIETVKRNTDRLLELTNDLLNIQDIEKGRLELRPEKLSLQTVTAQCVEDLQPLFTEKEQEVNLEIPEKLSKVFADPLRVTQVLTNLLDNAIKFSPKKGAITIRLEEDDGAVTVYVTDGGIGIDQKDLKLVFEPFAKIEKPAYFKGTGLGLSLAKKLVEAQGGKIWVSSIGKGRGSTFAFTLPKSEEELIIARG